MAPKRKEGESSKSEKAADPTSAQSGDEETSTKKPKYVKEDPGMTAKQFEESAKGITISLGEEGNIGTLLAEPTTFTLDGKLTRTISLLVSLPNHIDWKLWLEGKLQDACESDCGRGRKRSASPGWRQHDCFWIQAGRQEGIKRKARQAQKKSCQHRRLNLSTHQAHHQEIDEDPQQLLRLP
ncbi:hypothetical protein PCASD_11020 [Puccinia coronata f. sp. avenae]|uniref:Uncharacterized protein n=1 Tax=Puccinia coronata f. sp. avenae TaxID=200324 RepID=A0A2N5TEP6_9BASI|nr:hypothetical protein PCASD_11020 [Puccinia coronata f. sp. avenae]